MTREKSNCSVCGTAFSLEFRFQEEERLERAPDGSAVHTTVHFCSLDCVSRSNETAGRARCDVCQADFVVELVSQVLNHGGRRHHACSLTCRQQLLERFQGPSAKTLAQAWGQSSGDSPLTAPPPSAFQIPPAQRRGVVVPSAPPVSALPTARSTSVVPQRAPNAHPAVAVPLRAVPQRGEATLRPERGRSEPSSAPVAWQRVEASLSGTPRVLAIFNHKGGTGKTTTSLTIAAGLASRGKRVLLVDTDGQGNIAVSLGLTPERTLYHVLVMGLEPREVLCEARPNLFVLPSNETIAAAELYLAGRQKRDRVLATRLAGLIGEFDHVIVDCSPSLSLMNQNALVLADAVLCPVACDYLSLVGVRQVIRTVKQVNQLLAHPVRLWGVLPTMYDARARVCVEALETLREHFGDRCLDPIRIASRVKEAPSQAKTLFEHAPESTAAQDYQRVVARILSECEAAMAPQASAGGL